jgi:hypothetical protein
VGEEEGKGSRPVGQSCAFNRARGEFLQVRREGQGIANLWSLTFASILTIHLIKKIKIFKKVDVKIKEYLEIDGVYFSYNFFLDSQFVWCLLKNISENIWGQGPI